MENILSFKKIAILLIMFLAYGVFVCGQSVIKSNVSQLSGKVVDGRGENLELVNVLLYTATDSLFVTGTVTNKEGEFHFRKNSDKDLYIKLSGIGYQDTVYSLGKETIGTYTLLESNSKLEEITITASRPIVTIDDGKLTFDAPSLIKQRVVNNAFDVLGEIPGIEKLGDKISLIGSNSTTIIINGRASSMTADQVIEQLKNLAPERVKSVEVLYVTPPEYGVKGSSINVIVENMRKEKRERKTEIMFSGRQAYSFSPSAGLSYSSTSKKAFLNISYSFRYDKDHPAEELNAVHRLSINDSCLISLSSNSQATYKIHNLGISLDYDLRNKDVVSVSYNAKYTDPNNRRFGTLIADNDRIIDSNNRTNGLSNLQNISLNYSHKSMTFSADYSYYDNKKNQHLINSDFKKLEADDIVSNSRQTVNRGSFLLSNQHVFVKKQKLSYGINGMIGKSGSKQVSRSEKENSSGFLLDQSEYSVDGFVSWSQSLSKKVTLNAALSLEYYNAIARTGNINHTLWENWNLYPTLSVVYKLAPMKMLQFSISSERKYPTYWQSTPNVTYMNAYTLIEGNSSILPSTVYAGRLNFILKGKYIFQVFGNAASKHIQQSLYQSNEKLQAIYKIINLDKHDTFGAMTVLPFKVGRVWDARLVVSGFLIHDKGRLEDINFDREKVYGRFMLTNTIYLSPKRNLSFQLNGFYATESIQGVYDIKPMYNLSAGIVWDVSNRLKINVLGDDLLNGRQARTSTHIQNQNYNQIINNDSRMVSFTIRYNLGGYKEKKRDEIDTSRFGI